MNITNQLKMDLQQNSGSQRILAMQEDTNTRCVEIALYSGDEFWEIPAGTTVAVGFRKPDGTMGLYDKTADGTTAFKVLENRITVVLVPQMLTVPGLVQAVVTLYDPAGNQLSTFPFYIQVEANPAVGEISSADYVYCTSVAQINEALHAALARMEEAVSTVETKLEKGELKGKSAYDYARDGGFTGTEGEFTEILASVRIGLDGGYYTPEVSQPDKNCMRIAFSGSQNSMQSVPAKTILLPAGADGHTPVRGVDYWTSGDIAEIKSYVDTEILGGAW